MRFLFPVAMVLAPAATQSASSQQLALVDPARCPNATGHMAGKGGALHGDRLNPRKLAELPPAETYAAVVRQDERGCLVPVFYREVHAPRR